MMKDAVTQVIVSRCAEQCYERTNGLPPVAANKSITGHMQHI